MHFFILRQCKSKMQSQSQSQLILERVKHFFGSKFKVLNYSYDTKYEIFHKGNVCLELEFIPDDEGSLTTLNVSNLFKCNVNDLASHAALLGTIDQLAESIPFVQRITLRDASHIIVCDEYLQLNLLHILTTGKSWYNSFGYKSVDHAENASHNARTMNKTIDEVFARYANNDDFKRSIANPSKKLFPDLQTTMTVREYVKAVFHSVHHFPETKDKCTSEQRQKAFFLKGLIYYLLDDLKYNLELMKMVKRGPTKASPKSSPKGSAKASPKSGGNKRNKRRNKRTTKRNNRNKFNAATHHA